jgi:hypothetical protein
MTFPDPLAHALKVIRPALLLASADFIDEITDHLWVSGIQDAVARHDNKPLFNWIVRLLSFQGISDRVALGFDARHGGITWDKIDAGLRNGATCPKLRSYWHFADCRYRKGLGSCSEPLHLADCPLPGAPLRKGVLNEAAFGLFFFFRDICNGDFVGWIDARLAAADPGVGTVERSGKMMKSVVEPLSSIIGTGPKLWSMILADLLLGGDRQRERWVATGASMVAIDTLMHAFLHRTGILDRFSASHRYGEGCYASGGCADIVEIIAQHLDASEFNPAFPSYFPRYVQSAVWAFCAEVRFNICNGRRIDDDRPCQQRICPAYESCDRLSLHGSMR